MKHLWRYGYVEKRGRQVLNGLFKAILEIRRMPEKWRRSVVALISKHKGNVQSCSN